MSNAAAHADPSHRPLPPSARKKALPWLPHGIANTVIVLVLSLVTWWIFVDDKWSFLSIYYQPFGAILFWGIITVVWLGFTLEFWGLDKLPQPARGLTLIVITAAVAIGITEGLARGYGHFDPTFSASRSFAGGLPSMGAGYDAGSLWVLYGFFFYVTAVVNWGNWPFVKSGLGQPWVGLGQLGILFVPTTILYLILGEPAVTALLNNAGTAVKPVGNELVGVKPIMTELTSIGWFYSLIVAVVITGLLTENWPYSLAGSPGKVALASTIGNVVLGTVIYFVFRAFTGVLMGSKNHDTLSAATGGTGNAAFAAELGVCWVVWMILWQNCYANKPDHLPPLARYAARIVITLVLGVLTFLAYYFFIADKILHEPVAFGVPGLSIHGNALGWWNWVVLWALFYVLGFQSLGLPKDSDPDQTDTLADSAGTETHAEGARVAR